MNLREDVSPLLVGTEVVQDGRGDDEVELRIGQLGFSNVSLEDTDPAAGGRGDPLHGAVKHRSAQVEEGDVERGSKNKGKTVMLAMDASRVSGDQALIADEFSRASTYTQPRTITLVGLGKRDALSIRGTRAALYAIAKSAKKHRDKSIAVVFPYSIGTLDAAETTRLLAGELGERADLLGAVILARDESLTDVAS